MKTKHLLMAGLGLISFVGMSLGSVQKAFGQERVVQDNQARPYLAVRQGYDVGPHIRCSRDGERCFNLDFVGCDRDAQICLYQLSLINRKTIFHNPLDAYSCWSSGDISLLRRQYINCRIYGVSKEVSEYNKRRGEKLDDKLQRIQDRLLRQMAN
ncbi:MAG: hypothetical protein QNJ74_26945 [Trichodesmium sp. MO_231.B1]|nr:hypothetical protein [Trichodesmium sp. MO_231.B1]